MTGLTLASEGSGLLAKLQSIYVYHHLWSHSHWGCRMSEYITECCPDMIIMFHWLIATVQILQNICVIIFMHLLHILAWLVILLILWLLEPLIHALEKFVSPQIVVSYFRQATPKHRHNGPVLVIHITMISAHSHTIDDAPLRKSAATWGMSPSTLAFSIALFSSRRSIPQLCFAFERL